MDYTISKNTKLRILLYLFVALPLIGISQKKQSEAARPNIVFILADDMGYGDAGVYGQKLIKTPAIDQLAKSGMRFTDFYAGSTVCAPSRASLMTGQHTGRTYIRGNGELPLREEDVILPQLLKKQGYQTGMVGKWGLGLQNTAGTPEKKGWDFFSGHLHHVEGHYQHPDSAWQIRNGKSEKVPIPQGLYANEWFKNEAIRFIGSNRSQPFFLYVAFTLPHAELVVPRQFMVQYLDKNGNSQFSPEKAQPAGLHYGAQPYPKAAYAAMISQMDSYIGDLMQQLKDLKLDTNTLVIFASDNGTHTEGGRVKADALDFFQSSGPFRGIKRDLYEGGIRVPFIVSWPGRIAPNTTSTFAGAFWDVVPTLADLSGATETPPVNGISFLPELLGKSQKEHEHLYWEFYEQGFKQAVRKGTWKAIRFYNNGNIQKTELYNLEKDPGERRNLATAHPDVISDLERIMDKEHETSISPLFKITKSK